MGLSEQSENKGIIEALYMALSKGETENVAKHLASDLEWWFHGPPYCQHMMRVLTGELPRPGFCFEPQSVTAIDGDRVIAEGWEGAQAYWVHVWTLNDGLITQFREYSNTLITVRDLRPHHESEWEKNGEANHEELTLWQSHQPSESMPGLLLAI